MINLRRSFDVYYRDADRTARMDALNVQFVRPGGLAFDIGAHVGDRTGSFLRLGARVVALEPQPKVFRALRLIHGRKPGATLLQSAIGATPGHLSLFVNSANPTVSTAHRPLIEAASGTPSWQGERWDTEITVPVTTLDALIAAHGMPDFVKQDVEGFELEALRGLSHPIPALSFEITTVQRAVGLACLDRLAALGPYRFNFSLGEDHRLQSKRWMSHANATALLTNLPDAANSGDVFARLPG
jgi:FkbM family methyltransferase